MADFQGRLNEFKEKGIKIVAASVDSLENAQQMIERNKLSFPVAYGLDGEAVAGKTGAFFDAKKKFLHATGYIIRPEGIIQEAVYSTGPIGRLVASDTIRLIEFRKKIEAKNKS